MENENDYSLRDFLKVIFRRKSVIITAFISVMIFTYLGLQLKTPVYEAKAKLLILAKKQIDSAYYKDISDFRSSEMMLTQSEIVKSNPVIERAVRRLRYSELPSEYERQFCSPLKALLLDLKNKITATLRESYSGSQRDEIIFRTAVENLKRKIKVEPVKDTDLFTVAVTDFNPRQAAKIANIVSRSYCIFDLEQQLAEFQQKYGEKHLFVTQLKDNILRMEEGLTGETLSNMEAIGPASVKIIEQATVPIKPKETTGLVILAVSFIMSLILGTVLAFVFDSFDSTLKSPKDIKNFGIPFLGHIPRKCSLPVNSLLFARKILNTALILFLFAAALGMLADWAGSDINNPIVRLADKTTTPAAPVLILAAIALNFILSKALLLLARSLLRNNLLIRKVKKITPYLRAYQNVSEGIYMAMKGRSGKSILVTSVLPKEDKTSIIHNLGLYMAETARHKVLLIDANLRKPGLHKTFKIDNKNGLADILEGGCAFSDALHKISPNLNVIPGGKASAEPVNILDSEKLAQVITEAEKGFDIILFDCANLKESKDGLALSSYTDSVLLVISEGIVRKEAMEAAIEPLKNKKADFLGAILNNRTFAIPGLIYERA